MMNRVGNSSRACPCTRGSEMVSTRGDAPLFTDAYLEALARQFFMSPYADDIYADWPLDRRLDGFLRRQGLDRIVENGDAYDLVFDRVMAQIGVAPDPRPVLQSLKRFRLSRPR